MRLSPGSPTPTWTGTTWDGRSLSSDDYAERDLWLAFFRYASCPLCNLRVNDIITRWGEIEASGLAVVAVFQSPPEKMRQHVASQAPPFPLIADPSESLYATFGLEKSTAGFFSPANVGRMAKAMSRGYTAVAPDGTVTRVPADFLIRRGTIRDAFYGKVIADHIPFERVDAFRASA